MESTTSAEGGHDPCGCSESSDETYMFLQPTSSTMSNLFVYKAIVDSADIPYSLPLSKPPISNGTYAVRTCSVSGLCTYKPDPPIVRISFQGTEQSPGSTYKLEEFFIGSKLGYQGNGSWLWRVTMVPEHNPARALCTPETYFIRKNLSDNKDVFRLHCPADENNVLCVSAQKEKDGFPLLILPLDSANLDKAISTFKMIGAPH
ncbi:uncharacterized protein LOC135812762 [Sycon ciliatum]|uniref:uncharacterized protein LOC135812762 n=1 Tax=Sycon ciliatum TaxID=27933 RepID=UPI0031F61931